MNKNKTNKTNNFKKLHQLKKLLLITLTILISLAVVNADNWVCYDSTGKVTKSQLRAKFHAINQQPNSPLQIINTKLTSSIYTQSSEFRSCGDSKTYDYCPENDYFLKSTFSCAQRCNSFSGAHHVYTGLISGVDCGLGGGPSCSKFQSIGNCAVPSYKFVCGKSNTAWETITAENDWICPTCQVLAQRQNTEPMMGNISSFRDLSFDGEKYKYSNSKVDLSFMVYILACINRVPMLNLEVELFDDLTGLSVMKEYGIYAKHETLDYNKDNLGVLGEYNLPDQKEFKKTYTAKATLSAYRAWAWRERLVDSMKKITSELNLQIPGFPTNLHDLKFGDLYFSPDFITSKDEFTDVTLDVGGVTYASQTTSVNILKNFNKIDGYEMCNIEDLETYVIQKGISDNLLSEVEDFMVLLPDVTYESVKITSGENEELSFDLNNIKVSESQVGDVDDWLKDYKKLSNTKKYTELIKKNILTAEDIKKEGRKIVSGWYDFTSDVGCSNFKYNIDYLKLTDSDEDEKTELVDTIITYTDEYELEKQTMWVDETYDDIEYIWNEDTNTLDEIITEKTKPVKKTEWVKVWEEVEHKKYIYEDVIYLDLEFDAIWINDITANLDFEYAKSINDEYSWNFASLAELDTVVLAKCLYNWDECMLKEVKVGAETYKEVVDCGMGPPSNLAEPTMKDGARGKKTIEQEVTVYRTCAMGEDWISKYNGYSCVDGKYYRCNFDPDAGDELLGVVQAFSDDTLIRGDKSGYVCTIDGWKDIYCGITKIDKTDLEKETKAKEILTLIGDYKLEVESADSFSLFLLYESNKDYTLETVNSIIELNEELIDSKYYHQDYNINLFNDVKSLIQSLNSWGRWISGAENELIIIIEDLEKLETHINDNLNE